MTPHSTHQLEIFKITDHSLTVDKECLSFYWNEYFYLLMA